MYLTGYIIGSFIGVLLGIILFACIRKVFTLVTRIPRFIKNL